PRFQIGESLLPFNNDLFARLGIVGELEAGDFVRKYGAEVITADRSVGTILRLDQNLTAPHQPAFPVKRAEVDELPLRTATEAGVTARQETAVTDVDISDPRCAVVTTATGETIDARFIVDASGHGAILGSRVGGKSDIEQLKSVAVFAHYRNVPRPEGRDA